MGRSASDFFSPSFRETSPPPPRQVIGCRSQAGRHTPGIFTNPSQKAHEEPRLIIVTDPLIDHQVSARGGGRRRPTWEEPRLIIVTDPLIDHQVHTWAG